jgi:centrosomal protein CEP290
MAGQGHAVSWTMSYSDTKPLTWNAVGPQLTKLYLGAQRTERELRDELADSVSKDGSNADRARITQLEKAEAELKVEASMYVLNPLM